MIPAAASAAIANPAIRRPHFDQPRYLLAFLRSEYSFLPIEPTTKSPTPHPRKISNEIFHAPVRRSAAGSSRTATMFGILGAIEIMPRALSLGFFENLYQAEAQRQCPSAARLGYGLIFQSITSVTALAMRTCDISWIINHETIVARVTTPYSNQIMSVNIGVTDGSRTRVNTVTTCPLKPLGYSHHILVRSAGLEPAIPCPPDRCPCR